MKNISLYNNKECQLLAPPESTKLLPGTSFSEGTDNNIYDWKSTIVTAINHIFNMHNMCILFNIQSEITHFKYLSFIYTWFIQ